MALLDHMYEDVDGQTDLSKCKCRAFNVSGFNVQWGCNGYYELSDVSNDKNAFYNGRNYIAFQKYGSEPSWTCKDSLGNVGTRGNAYDPALCVEDVTQPWKEWTGSVNAEVPVKIECVEWNEGRKTEEKTTGLCPSDEDKFIWQIDNWSNV